MENKFFVLFAIIFSSICASAYDTQYFQIQSGKSRHIHVYDLESEISLKWNVQSLNGFFQPSVKVISQDNGFECQPVRNVLLFSGYNVQTKIWSQTWEVRVQWSPGADSSGCILEISHPNEESVQVDLYMNY